MLNLKPVVPVIWGEVATHAVSRNAGSARRQGIEQEHTDTTAIYLSRPLTSTDVHLLGISILGSFECRVLDVNEAGGHRGQRGGR